MHSTSRLGLSEHVRFLQIWSQIKWMHYYKSLHFLTKYIITNFKYTSYAHVCLVLYIFKLLANNVFNKKTSFQALYELNKTW